MSDPKEPESSTQSDKLVDLVQTLVFTFVVVLVVFRIIGCVEMYNIMERIQ
jgi:hypothetical protein